MHEEELKKLNEFRRLDAHTICISALCEEDKDQLNRIEEMLGQVQKYLNLQARDELSNLALVKTLKRYFHI